MSTNASRRTHKTGKYFEYFCEYVLSEAGYNVDEQVCIGLSPHGGHHNKDLIIEEEDILSLKFQQVQGTAESKIIEEMCDLQDACDRYGYKRAIIVLAGNGWKHADALISGVYRKWVNTPDVQVVYYQTFLDIYELDA